MMLVLCVDAEPAVRLAIYRKNKDASQAMRLYRDLIEGEAKRRTWSDVIEILQAVSEEPLFRGTVTYLANAVAFALKCAGDVAVNRGLEADGQKFADAKPHADWDGGYGNPDEINDLIQVETGGSAFTSGSLAVTALGWAAKYFITLERESYCDALRACTIPGGWRDAMFVFKAMKQAGHSMAAPVFDIMTLVLALGDLLLSWVCVWIECGLDVVSRCVATPLASSARSCMKP